MSQPSAGKQNDPSIICSFSGLERTAWAAIREQILEQGGEAAASLGLMESAVLTLCLEDCNAPSNLADILNAVRLGGGGNGPCLRYYDKVLDRVWMRILKQSTIRPPFLVKSGKTHTLSHDLYKGSNKYLTKKFSYTSTIA